MSTSSTPMKNTLVKTLPSDEEYENFKAMLDVFARGGEITASWVEKTQRER